MKISKTAGSGDYWYFHPTSEKNEEDLTQLKNLKDKVILNGSLDISVYWNVHGDPSSKRQCVKDIIPHLDLPSCNIKTLRLSNQWLSFQEFKKLASPKLKTLDFYEVLITGSSVLLQAKFEKIVEEIPNAKSIT